MEKVLAAIQKFKTEQPTYASLGKVVRGLKNVEPDYKPHLPEITDPANYIRNILCLEPLECALLRWPPGAESAVHYHKGFWGYVWVLDGTCENIEFKLKDDQMVVSGQLLARAGGVIDEPDGTIHKIRNPSDSEELVTVHFYYPALETLDGLAVYDLKGGRIGILNGDADTASFREPEEHFREIEENAFEYTPTSERKNIPSHTMCPVVPKPESEEIQEMIGDYYAEQAHSYDFFDLAHRSRKAYIKRINQIIADYLKPTEPLKYVLELACGTGRRAVKIRELAERDYEITGVDLSEEMCSHARNRGLNTHIGNWLELKIPDRLFDAATILYAFGHIPHHAERLESLRKIHRQLRIGAHLFLDVFNLDDQNEWGPKAKSAFKKLHMDEFGFELGDVFYKKTGGDAVAFLHYFTENELRDLLVQSGFFVERIYHIGYVQQSGEVLNGDEDRGALFAVARRI